MILSIKLKDGKNKIMSRVFFERFLYELEYNCHVYYDLTLQLQKIMLSLESNLSNALFEDY